MKLKEREAFNKEKLVVRKLVFEDMVKNINNLCNMIENTFKLKKRKKNNRINHMVVDDIVCVDK